MADDGFEDMSVEHLILESGVDTEPDAVGDALSGASAVEGGLRTRRRARRALKVTLVVVAVLAAGVVLMFAFGKPQAPSSTATVTQAADDGGDPSARGRTAPAADPSTPLAVEIPGCVCHSDDPKLVEEHAQYRMNQCAGCHINGTPTGAE